MLAGDPGVDNEVLLGLALAPEKDTDGRLVVVADGHQVPIPQVHGELGVALRPLPEKRVSVGHYVA